MSSPETIGNIAFAICREITGRVRVEAGGQEYRVHTTTPARGIIDGKNIIADIGVFPIGTSVLVMAGEGMDYRAVIRG